MRKEVNSQKVQKSRFKRVTNYYERFKKINNWHLRLTIPLVAIFAVLLLLFPLFNSKKNESLANSRSELAQLEEQREAKIAALDQGKTENFEDSLNQQEEQYASDFDRNGDYYTVDINDSSIKIDRNNIFVSDNAGVLSTKAKQKVYELNRKLDSNANGAQFMVVTIPRLPRGEDIESYATDIFNTLGVGNKEEDNGVLYLMSIADEKTRLEVGYGMEAVLTDSNAQDILDDDDVVEDYQDSDYAAGVMKTTDLVADYMNSKTPYEDARIKEVQSDLKIVPILFIIFYVLLVLLLLLLLAYLTSIRKTRKSLASDYDEMTATINDSELSEDQRLKKIRKLELYALVFYGMIYWQTYGHMKRGVRLGNVLQNTPGGKLVGRHVLAGDILYDMYGNVLTRHYYTSSYYQSKSSGSSGGGFGGGSFGGGSSGGGGASGGW